MNKFQQFITCLIVAVLTAVVVTGIDSTASFYHEFLGGFFGGQIGMFISDGLGGRLYD